MITYLKHILALLNSVFPPKCPACDHFVSEPSTLCSDCWKNIDFITEPSCKTCGYPLEINTEYCSDICRNKKLFLSKMQSAVIYGGTAADIIHKVKYGDKPENTMILSNWLYYTNHKIKDEVDLIIPVPLHKKKLWKRQYNQSALIAKSFSKKIKKKCEFDVLIRSKDIKSQSTLSQQQRIINVKYAFCVQNKDRIRNKAILLIDDVMTTSATLNECAKVLKISGAKKVLSLTVARTKIRGVASLNDSAGLTYS